MGKLLTSFKQHALGFTLLATSLGSVVASGFMVLKVYSYSSEVELITKEVISAPTPESSRKRVITVDVSGSVVKPGVISVPEGTRLSEALKLSGGLSHSAAFDYIHRAFNMSKILQDEEKIYLPSQKQIDEIGHESELELPGSAYQEENTTDVQKTVNINQASQSDLDELPGVGPVTAQKIIQNRPYASLEELVDKKAIGAATLEKIRDAISL